MTAAYHLPQRFHQKQNVTKQTHSDTELTKTILEEVTKERRIFMAFKDKTIKLNRMAGKCLCCHHKISNAAYWAYYLKGVFGSQAKVSLVLLSNHWHLVPIENPGLWRQSSLQWQEIACPVRRLI